MTDVSQWQLWDVLRCEYVYDDACVNQLERLIERAVVGHLKV